MTEHSTQSDRPGYKERPQEDSPSSLGRDYLWNTAWSLMTAASTVIILMVVTQVAGLAAAGLYSIALALGQQFQTLGMYEVRTFHVTDVAKRFSFGTYVALRFLTVALMIVGIVATALWRNGFGETALVVVLVAGLRGFDAFEDVFYSEYQRLGRLDIAGRAGFVRSAVTTVVFAGAVVLTSSLLTAGLVATVASLLTMLAMFLPPARERFSTRPDWRIKPLLQVAAACLPLFAASFIAIFIANAPRYGIENYLDQELQGVFAILFMPAVTINLLSTVVLRPLLTRMAISWTKADISAFLGVVRKGMITTAAAFLLVTLVTWVLGVPILNLIFGQDLSAYRAELIVLVFGGAMNAASVILYYALTTMRLQRMVFAGYVLSAVTISVMVLLLIPVLQLMGACVAYSGAMTFLTAFFALGLARVHGRGTGLTSRS